MKKKSDGQKAQSESMQVKLPLQFKFPDDIPSRYSNYAIIQHEEDIFTISFYDVQKPALLGSKEDRMNTIKNMKSIPAVCVARIVLSPAHFKRMIEAMQGNLENYQQR